MPRRAILAPAALVAVLALATLAACTPAPPPSPTPTFTSDAEAFAAAEATYRAYVDALNHVDLSDPATFEPVYALTTGDANAGERKSLSEYHANRWTVTGMSEVALFEALSKDANEVQAASCLDVSGVDVLDPSGKSVVNAERVAIQSMLIRFESSTTSGTGWVISSMTGRDSGPSCNR